MHANTSSNARPQPRIPRRILTKLAPGTHEHKLNSRSPRAPVLVRHAVKPSNDSVKSKMRPGRDRAAGELASAGPGRRNHHQLVRRRGCTGARTLQPTALPSHQCRAGNDGGKRDRGGPAHSAHAAWPASQNRAGDGRGPHNRSDGDATGLGPGKASGPGHPARPQTLGPGLHQPCAPSIDRPRQVASYRERAREWPVNLHPLQSRNSCCQLRHRWPPRRWTTTRTWMRK